MRRRHAHLDSPIGRLLLVGVGGALAGVYVADHDRAPRPQATWHHDPDGLAEAADQLSDYFAGARADFDLELVLEGTPFQRRVWEGLRTIPFGATCGYGELAARIGRPGAARAVGAANRANPLAIVVPCHRVVGASGALTGYGWGTDRKRWLLEHERTPPPPRRAAAGRRRPAGAV